MDLSVIEAYFLDLSSSVLWDCWLGRLNCVGEVIMLSVRCTINCRKRAEEKYAKLTTY